MEFALKLFGLNIFVLVRWNKKYEIKYETKHTSEAEKNDVITGDDINSAERLEHKTNYPFDRMEIGDSFFIEQPEGYSRGYLCQKIHYEFNDNSGNKDKKL